MCARRRADPHTTQDETPPKSAGITGFSVFFFFLIDTTRYTSGGYNGSNETRHAAKRVLLLLLLFPSFFHRCWYI